MGLHPASDDQQAAESGPDSLSPAPRYGLSDYGVLALATGLGAGFSPILPGTVGSSWGLLLTLALWQLPAFWMQALAMLLLAPIGIVLCAAGGRLLGKKDPSAVVVDEIISMPLVFALFSPEQLACPAVWLAGFLFHRVFDIFKPPPLAQLERLPGGLGIMADDLAAGIYANLVLRFCLQLGVFASWGC